MINKLRTAVYKNGYLVITAAWLFTLSFIVSNYWSLNSSPRKVQNKLEQQLSRKEERFNEIINDTALLSALVKNNKTSEQLKAKILKEKFGLFVYEFNDVGNTILSFWSSNKYYLETDEIEKPDGNYFVNHQNGDFELIKKTVSVDKKALEVIAMLPVHWAYFIENKYLNSNFEGFPKLKEQYEISNDASALQIHSLQGKALFKIRLKNERSDIEYDLFTIILRTIASILLLFFLNAVASDMVVAGRLNNVFILLVVVVFFLRFITYHLPVPFNFHRLELFDPSIYASNSLHPSLGDLLINTILVCWLVSFYKFYFQSTLFSTSIISKKIIVYTQLFLLAISCFLISDVIRSLVLDSKISFDATNFLSLNLYILAVSFTILGLLILLFYNLSYILIGAAIKSNTHIYEQILVVAISGLIYLSFNVGHTTTMSNLLVLLWLLIYIYIVHFRQKDATKTILQSSFFIFWVIFFAISVSAMIMHENNVVELEQRKRIAERLSLQADPSGESLLNIAATNFNDKFLDSNFNRLINERTSKLMKDSLITENFLGYLNKYDTRIYVYDSLFHPLFNDDSTKYATIRTIIITHGKPTGINGLYSYENSGEQATYIYDRPLKKNSSVIGYFFVIVKPKRYVTEALYPELFKQTQDLSADLNTGYAYGIYSNGKLISHFNDYSFPAQLNEGSVSSPGFEKKDVNDYNELWYNSGNGKEILIAKQNTGGMEFVSLFAYLFCSSVLVILSFRIFNYFLVTRFNMGSLKQLFQFNIRAQIHSIIIFSSLFSFIVIGVATISFFMIRFNKSNEARLLKSIQMMAEEIENKVRSQLDRQNGLTVNDIGLNGDLEKAIIEISETHNVDVNYFDMSGNLEISTQPYIYNKHLLSDKMEPLAFNELHNNRRMRFIQSETIGTLPYLSIYTPVVDEQGNAYAYLNIPYLNSQAELNQEVSGFLATLLNLNSFIFLVAGAIAFLITNKITSSFSLIGDKMREVSLGKVNEAIVWKGKDEIGILVNEYNKMVKKLEESAKALAQSEREGAWREMARQVAHEIKNPLTPMKLSIQYLQKSIDNGSANIKQLSQRVADTLVEQIDQLAKIAGDFSQFANISNVQLEKFDLSDVIASLINLYQSDSITFNWAKEEGVYEVKADKTQINRLFTNLLKNAIEAGNGKENIIINVNQKVVNNSLIVSIEDNGNGIPEDVQQKIFTPNFTTKSSGTGLGLAICKGIVEKANGRISFITKEGAGTIFMVELPLG